MMTRSKRFVEAEDEDSVVHKKKTADKKGTDDKKNKVRGESNQEKEEQINIQLLVISMRSVDSEYILLKL